MSAFDSLKKFVQYNQCEPFIRLVRFPRFKNLANGSQITFDYPITALIGPNGTNKSSILRALQGCPSQYNIGDYWFDTPLDRIEGGDGDQVKDPHRYIHGYRTPSGFNAEVIKTRVGKASRGLDYFETSAPRSRDGMKNMPAPSVTVDGAFRKKTRWRPIEKEVVYLDFRQELPAYDILMSFNWRRQKNDVDSKKKRIRRVGHHVNGALNDLESEHELYGANRILEAAEELGAAELAAVGRILQREYESIRLVKHDFFGVEGYTASLKTRHREYSEAYAGSGEFATIMMVLAIAQAPEASLILLDEPETSLHPGAQRELMRYIAEQCLDRKHQVVLATHSPAMVEELPDSARKLLDIDPADGRVRVLAQTATSNEAFSRIGAQFSQKTILVEDELAKAYVERVARIRGSDFLSSIEIVCVPGGAATIARRVIPVQAPLESMCSVLFDGDQRPDSLPRDVNSVPDGELQGVLDALGISKESLIRDGGSGNSEAQLRKARHTTLGWYLKRVGFLPLDVSPDALLLQQLNVPESDPGLAKSVWVTRTKEALRLLENEAPNAQQILAIQIIALAALPDDDPFFSEIGAELDRLLSDS
ncbi:ATP-dependent endonuclease [Salinibacterium sp. NK8237]|uniref:ATP-dependent nuclease n=1 Tax=Salinibacterium sp. NK8237 TaxID=2792038 RepID=UPI0018CD7CB0|nr:AAA family ATPase [Salinibacterium sp. NK8237]MBH0129976.1 AAA family ATPase [Salinibacterium sp. NK8237]